MRAVKFRKEVGQNSQQPAEFFVQLMLIDKLPCNPFFFRASQLVSPTTADRATIVVAAGGKGLRTSADLKSKSDTEQYELLFGRCSGIYVNADMHSNMHANIKSYGCVYIYIY